ncbi:MAG TPA: sigma-70 family RNA polymerase sigma factor [Chitinophagaceae bacterium]|nr:sigma-70 family RNA polymerase sigma factor [Chitinophagaceae bacterium]
MEVVKKYNEEELIFALQQQDQHAFSYLYDNYSGALFGLIYKMVNDKELAEDILQETFVKIWNNFSNYDSTKGRLFTWMINLTRNLTIDTLRSKGYKKQSKIHSDENSVSNFTDTTNAADKFDAMGIRKQLTLLKNDQKLIIDLAYFGGFTQDEISKQLGIPLGTVKTRMRAAILELRKVLQDK